MYGKLLTIFKAPGLQLLLTSAQCVGQSACLGLPHTEILQFYKATIIQAKFMKWILQKQQQGFQVTASSEHPLADTIMLQHFVI